MVRPRTIARCPRIPDPVKPAEPNWAIIVRTIGNAGAHKRWTHAAGRMGGDGAVFESLPASLDAVKRARRDPTTRNSLTLDWQSALICLNRGYNGHGRGDRKSPLVEFSRRAEVWAYDAGHTGDPPPKLASVEGLGLCDVLDKRMAHDLHRVPWKRRTR